MEPHSRVRQRLSQLASQRGQMLVMFLIFLIPLTLAGLSVYNVGTMTTEKMKIQNAADNAAYSAAIWEARYMNLAAYTTRAMVANYDTIALVTGFYSFADALDGFLAELQAVLQLGCDIPIIDIVACPLLVGEEALHVAVHIVNQGASDAVLGISPYLQAYNSALSAFEEALYLTTQAGRAQLIQKIAAGVDTNFQYWVGSEVFNFQELSDRRDWTGTDKDNGLRLTVERSLNAFSNGGSFRDFANLIPVIGDALSHLPCLSLTIGPEGFDGPGFDHITGEENPTGGPWETGGERTLPNGKTQMIVRGGDNTSLKDTIYQLDHSGISISVGGITCPVTGFQNIFSESAGHYSDDQFNSGADIQHRWDSIIPDSDPIPNDDPQPVSFDTLHPQDVSDVDGTDRTENPTGDFIAKAIGDPGCIPGLALVQGFEEFIHDCRTEAKLSTKLKDMKVTIYKDDGDDNDNGKRVEGPRVFVYLSKPSKSLPLFSGLGLTEGLDTNLPPPITEVTGFTPSMEAYAFARVYFTQNRKDKKFDKETIFNPFWAGRLERLADKNSGIELLH